MTSNAGAPLLREADHAIGLSRQAAACFTDGRRQDRIEHSVETLIGQRIHGIALGYEDLNDHDELRHDPVLGLVSGKAEARRSDCAVLAGKSTLNRLEHAPKTDNDRYRKLAVDEGAMKRLFVSLFLKADATPPKRIILDLDATDDPIHGDQEGRFFHGDYKCYCYLPLYVFCGRELLLSKLRPANIDASAGAKEEVAFIVAQIRQSWPDADIWLRADSGFCREDLMGWCEAHGVHYVPASPAIQGSKLPLGTNWRKPKPNPRKAANPNGFSRNCAAKHSKPGAASAALWPRRSIFQKARVRVPSSPR